MWKKLLSVFSKPYFFISFISLGIIALVVAGLTDIFRYKTSDGLFVGSRLDPGRIKYMDISENGMIAINETLNNNDGYIGLVDMTTGKAEYMIDRDVLGDICGTLSRFDVLTGENGKVWLHCVQWSDNMSAIDVEGIVEILPGGHSVMLLNSMDYGEDPDPPTKEPRLCAFAEKNGVIRFARPDMFGVKFYSVDSNGGERRMTGEWIPDDGTFAVSVFALEDDFLVVMSDGCVYRVGADGSRGEEPLYRCTSGIGNAENGDYITGAAEHNGIIYVSAGFRSNILYRLENGGLQPVADIYALYEGEIVHPDQPFYEGFMIDKIIPAGDKIYLNLGSMTAVYDDNGLRKFDRSFEMPFKNAFISNLPFIAVILIGIGAVMFIVFIITVKKSLLMKQLLVTVPVMLVISVIICREAGKSILDIYIMHQSDSVSAISDISSMLFDGEKLKELISSDEWSDEDYYFTRYELNRALSYNRGMWNALYDLRLCIPDDNGRMLIMLDSRRISRPFTQVDYAFDMEIVEDNLTDPVSSISTFAYYPLNKAPGNILSFYSSIGKMISVTPVVDSDFETVAYVVAVTDDWYLSTVQEYTIQTLMNNIAPYMIILLLIISAISVVISLRIRKATKTVVRIADGDLSVRIDNNSHDELGEICRQFNYMAENLETIFDEKDKNEHFYYKFVPEKFRELLGKDSITDLALGDAESKEFSVLFCDIRSFSINSEMMTAKENFDFVNVIFGIAGPVIREHGGFVDKYIGDAVMALFESPDDAVQAGIRIYHDVVLDPSVAERLNVRDINIGVGIHTGIARIGIVGEEERLSGTVISDTVNLSSRLESLTKIYHTAMIISKDTIDRMKDPDSLNKRYIGMVQVAGVNDVTALYEILDCLGDDERERRTANKEDFREAVRLFHLGRREEAVSILKEIQRSGKSDPVVDMYCDYIANMSEEDKANVFRFVRK